MHIATGRRAVVDGPHDWSRTMSAIGCELDKHLDESTFPSSCNLINNLLLIGQNTNLFGLQKRLTMGTGILSD